MCFFVKVSVVTGVRVSYAVHNVVNLVVVVFDA